MRNKKVVLCLLLPALLISAACTIPVFSQGFTSLPTDPLINAENEGEDQTATPFQPLDTTATATQIRLPDQTATPTATSTPTVTPTLAIPEDQVNIVLFGNDYRPALGGRTDVIVLVSINTDDNVVNIISFPRDLYVEIPGRGMDRLNTAYPYGGFELFRQTMQANFNIQPDYYMMTNFTGFANIINSLGGIDVYVSYQLTDQCDLPQEKDGSCTVGPGTVHMDGETTLWYVRSRHTSNDFDRNRRQQEVLLAILRKMLQWDVLSNAATLYNSYRNSVDTNLPLDEFLRLVPVALFMNEEGHLNRYAIDSGYTSNYRTESGAAVLMPNMEKINELILKVIYRQE